MLVLETADSMQAQALQWRAAGDRIGLVPTMGFLHEGHLSLVRAAREEVGPEGRVVVSLFVNPAQFGPAEDLDRYPRDRPRDERLCREAGVDLLFAPAASEMYPVGFSTWVVEERLSAVMEGVSRPGHFRGVTTVVAKLFHLVLPDIAVFGAKDYQQAAVICQMVRDLAFPVRIRVAPTLREPDGLAMSSRNQYLSPEERRQAAVLRRALLQARAWVAEAPRPAGELQRQLRALIESEPAARVDTLHCFHPETLEPVDPVRPGDHLALAVFVGRTRLIDNERL